MEKIDLHIHTNYCDGKNTIEEMIVSAIEKGLKKVGILYHSYTSFDESYCIKKENISKFKEEIEFLKDKYKGKIEVLYGIEKDYYSYEDTSSFDYIIGSTHYLKINDKYYPLDLSKESFIELCEKEFNGDYYALAEKYYEIESNIYLKTKCDIIGHFDLISKYNENGNLFDEDDIRYENAWKRTIDYLIQFDVLFEINVGAISRGYKTSPYPLKKMQEYIKMKGGKFILSSDAHKKEDIAFHFNEYENKI